MTCGCFLTQIHYGFLSCLFLVEIWVNVWLLGIAVCTLSTDGGLMLAKTQQLLFHKTNLLFLKYLPECESFLSVCVCVFLFLDWISENPKKD